MSSSDSDTSDPKSQVICEYCDRKFHDKYTLAEHLKTHAQKSIFFICYLCNLRFKSKGLLGYHLINKHGIQTIPKLYCSSIPEKKPRKSHEPRKVCDGCKKRFSHNSQLESHIRKKHFNLISKPPYYMQLDVNQKWYETVLNSKYCVEVKKMNANKLFMRRVKDLSVKPIDMPRDLIDLRVVYPSGARRFPCLVCSELCHSRDLRNHVMSHNGVVNKLCSKCNCCYMLFTTNFGHVCPT